MRTITLLALLVSAHASAQCDPATVLGPGVRTSLNSGANPWHIASGDLNNDGNPDLVVTEFGTNTVAVMLGAGDGSFAPIVRYGLAIGIGRNPAGIAIADFNADTVPDIAIGNATDSTVTILTGVGDGSFTAGGVFDAGFFVQPRDIAVADLDNDGDTDIVVSSEFNQIRILHNNGDGTFAPPIFTVVLGAVVAVELGDVNGDHIPDAVVADVQDNEIEVAFGNGAGGFGPFAQHDTITTPNDLKLADMDNDGDLDIIVCGFFADVAVHPNPGSGTFFTRNDTSTLGVPRAIDAADLDHDGNTDVLVATSSTIPQTISLLSGNGDATLGTEHPFPGLNGADGVVLADFDHDGSTDAAAIFENSNDLLVYLNTCDANTCAPDLAPPFGTLNFFDITAYIAAFNAMDPAADFAAPFGTLNFFDISAFIAAFNAGCP